MKKTALFIVAAVGCIVPGALAEGLPVPGGKWDWASIPKYEEYAKYPGSKSKWTENDHFMDRENYLTLIKDLKSDKQDPAAVEAMPAAEDFPGLPRDGSPVVEGKVSVVPSYKGWHSTGHYAMPGVPVTVTMPEAEAQEGRFEVIIGAQHGKLGGRKTWSRSPEVSFTKKVSASETVICNPFGGLIYINVLKEDEPGKSKPIPVKISPVIKAPTYILGKTSKENWENQLTVCGAPWGEIITPRLVMTMPTDQLAQITDIERAAKGLQDGMAAQDWLAGWDKMTPKPENYKRPMRFVFDPQPAAGAGHAGYPAVGMYYFGKGIIDGSMFTTGLWGIWHELGHNHQADPWWMKHLGEVTVNFYTVIAQHKLTGCPVEKAWNAFSFDSFAKDIDKYFTGEQTYDEINSLHVVKLFFFNEMTRELGLDLFRNVSLRYHRHPYVKDQLDNRQKWDWILIALSEESKRNLAPYFEAWRIDITPGIGERLRKYPVWFPSNSILEKYMGPNAAKAKQEEAAVE